MSAKFVNEPAKPLDVVEEKKALNPSVSPAKDLGLNVNVSGPSPKASPAPSPTDKKKAEDEEEKKEEVPYAGVSHRFQVTETFKYGSVVLRELKGAEKTDGAPILDGFPGLGITSMIAAGFLCEQLKLPMIGVMTSESFPALGLVYNYEGSSPVRIYGDERLVVVRSEVKVAAANPDVVVNIGQALFDFAKRHKSKCIVTIDGMPLEALDKKAMEELQKKLMKKRGVRANIPGQPKVEKKEEDNEIDRSHLQFFTTSELWGKFFTERKCKPIKEALIPSITGHVVAEAPFIDVDVVCMLAPVSKLFPDAWGAVHIVRLLEQMFPSVNINTQPLEKKAKELESKIATTMNDVINEQAMDAAQSQAASAHMYS